MVLDERPVRDVVSLLEDAVKDRDKGEGDASLEQLALAAISELIMAYDHTHTLDHVMNSFQYKWGSAALHDADPGDYSPALHRVVENISTAYTA